MKPTKKIPSDLDFVTFTIKEESFTLLKSILDFYEDMTLDCLYDSEDFDDIKRIRNDLQQIKQLKRELKIK